MLIKTGFKKIIGSAINVLSVIMYDCWFLIPIFVSLLITALSDSHLSYVLGMTNTFFWLLAGPISWSIVHRKNEEISDLKNKMNNLFDIMEEQKKKMDDLFRSFELTKK